MTRFQRAVEREMRRRYAEMGRPPITESDLEYVRKITEVLCRMNKRGLDNVALVDWYFKNIASD